MKYKSYVLLPVILFIGFLFFTATDNPPVKISGDFKYVGVTSCVGACHKSDAQGKQLDIWKESKHSQAYKVLQTPEADKIAADKGFTTPAAETPECIKCHVLGKDLVESEFTETFDKTEGVQCETCHGPGSEYKKSSIMKDKQKAMDNGLVIHTEKEAFCTHCHNSDSPTFKSFNYDEYWAKIQHMKPAN